MEPKGRDDGAADRAGVDGGDTLVRLLTWLESALRPGQNQQYSGEDLHRVAAAALNEARSKGRSAGVADGPGR